MEGNCKTEFSCTFFCQYFCVYRTTSNYFAQLENWTIMYYYNVVILCSRAFFLLSTFCIYYFIISAPVELTYLPLMRVYHPPNIWLTIIYLEDESWIPAGRNFSAKKYLLVSLIFLPSKAERAYKNINKKTYKIYIVHVMLKCCSCTDRKTAKSWYALITVAYSALNQTCSR